MTTVTSIWQERSEHVDELYASMAKAFGELRNAPRTCYSNWAKKDRKTGELLPDYADLATVFDTVRATYSKFDLSIRQTFHPFKDDGTLFLVTTIGHKSGQFERSYLPMKGNIQPQEIAKTATFLKRVALCAAVGIAADDDDDGETANRSTAVAVANDEARIERALADKIRAAKDAAGRKAEIERAKKGAGEGMLPESAVARLQLIAADLDAKQAAKPEKPKKELVSA
jgi:hypothetical protein